MEKITNNRSKSSKNINILDDSKDRDILDYSKDNFDHLAHASASIVEDVLDLMQLGHPVMSFKDVIHILCFGTTPGTKSSVFF